MRIIGIDPGSRKTGYGIIDMVGNHFQLVDCGVIENTCKTIPERLQIIFTQLLVVIDNFNPQAASVEQVFMHVNPDAALKLGQARGAAICALTFRGVSVAEYTAKQVKNAVVGKGQASKHQVQFMVQRLLTISSPLQEDAADGLACAFCHAFHLGTEAIRKNAISKPKYHARIS